MCVLFDSMTDVVPDFGNRPRRLYVVVNPASGEGTSLRVWSKVERLFQLTHITTEILCKLTRSSYVIPLPRARVCSFLLFPNNLSCVLL